MDKAVRNELRNVVTRCRSLLERAVGDVLQGQFGIHQSGVIEDADSLTHLSDEDREYRSQIVVHLEHIIASGLKPKDAVQQLIREIAFTHLNRLCAFKMMEERELLEIGGKSRRAVSQGIKSPAFVFYLADQPDDEKLWRSGQQDIAYRHFLIWLGSTFADEIKALFSPNDPANRLFPPQRVLDQVLELINDDSLNDIWKEDETIGWIYQYFTPKELREESRKKGAPQNSYELAFRNQFYTPSYVVQFLSDNTLGRIWYEMRQGQTRLKEQCRYLVYRPNEKFLAEGEKEPARGDGSTIYIPYRAKKDPRTLRMLDPAGGSGHFLLYCFGLFQTIYEEAWDDPQLGAELQRDYNNDLDSFRKAIPALILRHNLHCIDIDLRSTQIAALALWLRAQRAYQELGLERAERPPITKSNIVCAEPMPGEAKLLEDFAASLRPKVLGDMVRFVFEKMKLAGEAGSLLKIEEEISRVVAEKKRQYKDDIELATDKFGNVELLTRGDVARLSRDKQAALDFSDITDDQFWETAEEQILEALRRYSQEAAANGQGLLRKLFAEDAERGFAFVDICRKRFDVLLMNPPFGAASKTSKAYIDSVYPRTKYDIYAAFVERGAERLCIGGNLGAITSRTGFFLSSFRKWREEILLQELRPTIVADLGADVLDTAMVETTAYCLENNSDRRMAVFFRLLPFEVKELELEHAVTSRRGGNTLDRILYEVNPASFSKVPNSPFAYWVSDHVRELFETLPAIEGNRGLVRVGLQTDDDARFIRTWWEVHPNRIAHEVNETFRGKRWIHVLKGGDASGFYSDIPMVVNWENEGKEVKEWITVALKGGHWSRHAFNTEWYCHEGLSWAVRTRKFMPSIVPKGCIPTVSRYLLVPNDKPLSLLAVLNSSAVTFLLRISNERYEHPKFIVGTVQRLPLPDLSDRNDALGQLALRAVDAKRRLDTVTETGHFFHLPALLCETSLPFSEGAAAWQAQLTDTARTIAEVQAEIDVIAFQVYGIGKEDRQTIEEAFTESSGISFSTEELEEPEEDESSLATAVDEVSLVEAVVSYAVGCALGRWDVRLATGDRPLPELPDPFAPLPIYSLGMLTEEPRDYPLAIDRDGILPDDPDHADDIVRRVHEVFTLIWRERAEAMEQEACAILGVKELRDYFRKPAAGGFWADHIARYSKSRRKAPIYWLLQSARKNYGLWLYYHRLDRDTLSKALINYVEPKLRLEENRLAETRAKRTEAGSTGSAARTLERQIERQEELLSELRDFHDKLRRAADLNLDPDLNDGVVLNIAPLWELVPWKETKKYWDELQAGKYEWSSIAKQLKRK
jgi:hypothetical protein